MAREHEDTGVTGRTSPGRPGPDVTGRAGAGPLVGVLGGMGPAATVDFYAKLVRATPATTDQQHLRVVIWADPTVPDRSAALLHGGPDPTDVIEQGALALAAAGADLIAIPCNTAHAFVGGVSDRVGVPLVHMIQEAAWRVAAVAPSATHVGLLATTGTLHARLYQDELGSGMEVVTPGEEDQDALMRAIDVVKSGGDLLPARKVVVDLARGLVRRGAQVLIVGCTEIPLVLRATDVSVPVVDPAVVLAEAVVARTRGR